MRRSSQQRKSDRNARWCTSQPRFEGRTLGGMELHRLAPPGYVTKYVTMSQLEKEVSFCQAKSPIWNLLPRQVLKIRELKLQRGVDAGRYGYLLQGVQTRPRTNCGLRRRSGARNQEYSSETVVETHGLQTRLTTHTKISAAVRSSLGFWAL
jgi:hypothetical protein